MSTIFGKIKIIRTSEDLYTSTCKSAISANRCAMTNSRVANSIVWKTCRQLLCFCRRCLQMMRMWTTNRLAARRCWLSSGACHPAAPSLFHLSAANTSCYRSRHRRQALPDAMSAAATMQSAQSVFTMRYVEIPPLLKSFPALIHPWPSAGSWRDFLPPPNVGLICRYVFVCCLFVCLSVSNFAQKLLNGLAWNFQGNWQWAIEQMIKFWWRSGLRSRIRIQIATLVRGSRLRHW